MARQNFYPWMGRTTNFREWVGDRVLQRIEAHGYTLVNRKFEDSVAIGRDDIEDDMYGLYTPMIEQLGWDTKVFPNILIFGLLKAAATNAPVTIGKITVPVPICFDGLNFFSTAHPVGPMADAAADTTASNINTGGGLSYYWYIMDCGRPIRPLIYQERRPFTVTRMNTLTDERVWNQDEFRYGVDAGRMRVSRSGSSRMRATRTCRIRRTSRRRSRRCASSRPMRSSRSGRGTRRAATVTWWCRRTPRKSRGNCCTAISARSTWRDRSAEFPARISIRANASLSSAPGWHNTRRKEAEPSDSKLRSDILINANGGDARVERRRQRVFVSI